ncbi:transcriptional regulator [Nisaea acidiphila]|uniref:Transcriptional regulator n=1 Tax=Nisaea acidiphila TaxID=1862145 RepID=A0A9J7AZ61_9PROT|nr:transcriptional regulator [Nisaea acidiphila]UUX51548.1 transcriptional regulator [Nisaea acidiphila]
MFAKALAKTILFAVLLVSVCSGGQARAGTELLMVEQAGCEWCAAWNAEIGEIYHLTPEGKRAPLRRQDLFDKWPADITIKGQVHFTPTFILLVDGKEAGRIEGYPGEHFFWPLLAQMLNRTPRGPDN